jgi:23S rRNA (adenine2503-C2)-methyltransferase
MPTREASTISPAELRALLHELGEPEWRASQLADAVWQPSVRDLSQVRQLPSDLRARLAPLLRFRTIDVVACEWTDTEATAKLLCRLQDGQTVETVLIRSNEHVGPSHAQATTPRPARKMVSGAVNGPKKRTTVCVSTQVGCAVGCPFCATGQLGLRRNCSPAEIVDQVRIANEVLVEKSLGRVTHVVFMGMGEPLANVDATITALRVLTGSAGLSARRITVSTSGVVPGIRRLTAEALPVTLAISLHAATDALRDHLVPVNRAFKIDEVVDAGIAFAGATGRRLTFEWCLIAGVNDTPEQAERLRALARRAAAHVNIIPMNAIPGSSWRAPDSRRTRAFLSRLGDVGVTLRATRGARLDAACGQLRASLDRRRALPPALERFQRAAESR